MGRPALTDDAIYDILTSYHVGFAEMGRRYQRSHQSIVQIRYGQTHEKRCPDVPRWVKGRTCEHCEHYRSPADPCKLGFPDPIEDGINFAQVCTSFRRAANEDSSGEPLER